MDWLRENPIGNMAGPDFLAFYLVVIAATLCACAWRIARSQHPTPQIPEIPFYPDPYEIAYLRGGANEVFRLALFSLFQRGYLEISGKGAAQKIGPAAAPPNFDSLSALARTTLAAFAAPQRVSGLLQSAAADRISVYCQGYERQMRQNGLLETGTTRAARGQAGGIGLFVIAGLGCYKWNAAVLNGHHNVGFLILMGFFALIVLAVICFPQRLSKTGKDYLRRLQGAFSQIKTQAQISYPESSAEDAYLLTMSVFGMEALAGTPYAPFHQMFCQAASAGGADSSGGSWSSCSSDGGHGGGSCSGGGGHSCGGGSSCGGHGGCGGCGGGH